MLLQNLFEYFSILSYLRVSKANRSLESPSKCSSQPCSEEHKGKMSKMETNRRHAHRQPSHSKCKKTLSQTKPVLFFQVRHKRKKVCWLTHEQAKKKHKTLFEEQSWMAESVFADGSEIPCWTTDLTVMNNESQRPWLRWLCQHKEGQVSAYKIPLCSDG